MEITIAIHEWLIITALVSARILPSFILLPFLNNNVLHNTIRYPVAMLIGFVLFPNKGNGINVMDLSWLYMGLLLKELTIGLFIACLLSMPFWLLYIVGNIIDQQRGATLSSTYDPISGIDSSELASFCNLFAAVIFLLNGGMHFMVETIYLSYQVLNPLTFELPELRPFISVLNKIIGQGFIIASPVVAAFFIIELVLGLLSRYSPQMNAFSLALSVKSLIAFFILLIYFTIVTPTSVASFSWDLDLIGIYF